MRVLEGGRSVFSALFMLAFLMLGPGFVAQASAQTAVCTGTDMATYNPALTNTQQNIQITDTKNFNPCLVVGYSGITSATVNSQSVRDFSCEALLTGGPSERVINWSNRQSSTFSYTSSTSEVNGNLVITFTGNISAGLFVNQSAVAVIVITSLSHADFLTACSGSGITSVSGTATLSIAPPL